MKSWSNLAKVVYKRTYSRNDNGLFENWNDTIERVLKGNKVPSSEELDKLRYFMLNRKAMPAGRGLWFSGAPAHENLGGAALNNCWFTTANDIDNFVMAQDLLMLGGGVGLSVEHKFVSKLSKIKKNVKITHVASKDADFIVPDSRAGWNELTRRSLESFFSTGKSFTYSTVCIRGAGESIRGFGGKASGPQPLVKFIDNLNEILGGREGKHIRPIDAADIICAIGEFVVAGNVRRSAIIILGDPWDKDYLKSKRWDLGITPSYRGMANYSVVVDDVDDLHPLFWKTYEHGEPFGIFNRKNTQTYGRMGEKKKDTAEGVNPCVTGETEILTDDGYKRIDSLVDQNVTVWNGFEWSSVVPKITGKDQEIITVSFSDGRTISCTRYHKFHIAIGYNGKADIVEAKDLVPGMKLIKHKFPVIEHGPELEHAYTNGFVSAEGMELKRNLSVYKPKEMCLDRLDIKTKRWSESNCRWDIILNHIPMSKKFVPIEYNLRSKIEWLSGLFDGDGTELKEGGLQLISIDQEFLANVQKLLTTIGIQSKVVDFRDACYRLMPDGKDDYKEYFCQKAKRICIGAVQIQELKRLGLKCSRMSFDKSPQRDASQFVIVTDVTEAGMVDTVYCFNEPKNHTAIFNGVITGQCAEATLENGEPCNLQEIFLPNLKDEDEFVDAARLMHRYGKRVTMEKYHNPVNDDVVKRNRRIGTGITGCLQSNLFNPKTLDMAYKAIEVENISYSQELKIPASIRTTVVKPSGTLSLLGDVTPGIHPSYSRYYIRRVRFAANDRLIPILKAAGHNIEPVQKLDGTLDHGTLVVDFYCSTPENTPCADEGFDTWKQLDTLMLAQRYWSDQAVSVTVYYKKDEIEQIKAWLSDNLKNIKTISFLCHNDHGFKQAPLEAVSKETFERSFDKVKDIDMDSIDGESQIDGLECEGGVCPVK